MSVDVNKFLDDLDAEEREKALETREFVGYRVFSKGKVVASRVDADLNTILDKYGKDSDITIMELFMDYEAGVVVLGDKVE